MGKLIRPILIWMAILFAAYLLVQALVNKTDQPVTIPYSKFEEELDKGNVKSVKLANGEITGEYKFNIKDGQYQKFKTYFGFRDDARLQQKLKEKNVETQFQQVSDTPWWYFVANFLPYLLLFGFFILIMRQAQSGGSQAFAFGRSKAKLLSDNRAKITFDDVAGVEEAKEELKEVVDFLKYPKKYQALGARIPKGVLLLGSPGTGKTLLGRAIAGEAGVPFYYISGSDFVEMFVGVGASRVRDLFEQAKKTAPCIVFVDEIDAVGRQRGAGLGGGHDEREQTLNQILGEMDGFSPSETVIVIAATNRPDVLDPALLRPGRFDRHLTVSRPSLKGRIEMFKVHVRDVPLAEDVDLEVLAAATVGLTGADIHNIVNEAALWAARNNKTKVEATDFEYARDKVLIGAKREEVLTDDEKEKTAYHEAGHTLAAWLLPHARRVHKVTIIPRGRSLGNTQMLPAEDRVNMSAVELRDHLVVMLAGRAAEEVIYNETTVGAENDLEQATGIARHMVTHWGMSERLGPVSYKQSDDDPFLGREIHRGRPFSERTMEVIDEEVTKILHDADQRAVELLGNHREKLEIITRELVRQEELDEQDITKLIGPSAHPRRPTEALASA